MDTDQIYSQCLVKAKSNIDFIRLLASDFKVILPVESKVLTHIADQVMTHELARNKLIIDAPFSWLGSAKYEVNIENSFFGRVAHAQRVAFHSCNENLLTNFINYSIKNDIHYSSRRISNSPILSKSIILIFKEDQPTGAHLNVFRIKNNYENIRVCDVKGKQASDVLDLCNDKLVVIINSLQPITLWPDYALFIQKLDMLNIRIVYYLHEGEDILESFSKSQSVALKAFKESIPSARFLLLTRSQGDLIKRIFSSVNSSHMYNQVNMLDMKDIYPLAINFNTSNNVFITIIGSLQSRKGIDFTKKLAKKVFDHDSRYQFLWLGEPNKFLSELWCDSPPNLHFLGRVSAHAKNYILSQSCALLMPSEVEPLSFAVAEALLMSVPVIYRPNRCGLLNEINSKELDYTECFPIETIDDKSVMQLLEYLKSTGYSNTSELRHRIIKLMHPMYYLQRLRKNILECMKDSSNETKVSRINKSKPNPCFDVDNDMWLDFLEKNR